MYLSKFEIGIRRGLLKSLIDFTRHAYGSYFLIPVTVKHFKISNHGFSQDRGRERMKKLEKEIGLRKNEKREKLKTENCIFYPKAIFKKMCFWSLPAPRGRPSPQVMKILKLCCYIVLSNFISETDVVMKINVKSACYTHCTYFLQTRSISRVEQSTLRFSD